MYFIVLTGCNKMTPAFVKATQTLKDAEEYLEDKASIDPTFNEKYDIEFWREIIEFPDLEDLEDLNVSDILDNLGCLCYTFNDVDLFEKLAPNSCTCRMSAFVFYQPEGDLALIMQNLRDVYIF